ncbi:MAG TPA: AmmeMemoRadiSam system radical SAM enzyme [Bacteroidota bacterium]|nr:AmmeMemoRadiSam system radical SAM enzyme [Bacteroidota bacterium]
MKLMNDVVLSKREFMRTCLFAAGGCMLGLERLNALGGIPGPGILPAASDDDLWKWSKEGLFYVKTDGGVLCQKCPHGCLLAAGEVGKCRNRVNRDGKMYSIAYGNPCAVHIDPIEKKPLFHFLPSTRAYSIAAAGCNLRCLNCQNWQISQFSPRETSNFDLMPEKVVEECLANRCESIAYTYSEPTTFYEYAFDTAAIARKNKIRNVWKSGGYINEEPLRHLCKVIDAANIDLKSFDNDVYWKLNEATLDPVLRTLRVFKEEKVWLEITNLVIPGWTDDLAMIRRMCEWLVKNNLDECPLHFSRFTPMYKLNQLPITPVSVLEQARRIAFDSGMHYAYIGNVPGHEGENTYCHACKKLLLERRGFTILTSNMAKGTCRFCGAAIPGVWS